MTSALSFAHRQGIVHGHVDESNVLFDQEDNAYLADFRIGTPVSLEPADDVAALAGLVRGLTRGSATDQLDALLERAEAGDGRVSAGDIERALAGADYRDGAARPATWCPGTRTRDCGPSPSPTRATSSAARRWRSRSWRCSRRPGPTAGSSPWSGRAGAGSRRWSERGLLPRLTAGAIHGSDTWFAAEMLPGATPWRSSRPRSCGSR